MAGGHLAQVDWHKQARRIGRRYSYHPTRSMAFSFASLSVMANCAACTSRMQQSRSTDPAGKGVCPYSTWLPKQSTRMMFSIFTLTIQVKAQFNTTAHASSVAFQAGSGASWNLRGLINNTPLWLAHEQVPMEANLPVIGNNGSWSLPLDWSIDDARVGPWSLDPPRRVLSIPSAVSRLMMIPSPLHALSS